MTSAQTMGSHQSLLYDAHERFECFGGECSIYVGGDCEERSAAQALELARRQLLRWHAQFSRFMPDSELCQLNGDPRSTVQVSPMMARFVAAAVWAAELTGGLVDPTLGREIVAAGYAQDLARPTLGLAQALAIAPPRGPGHPRRVRRWELVRVEREAGTVSRPPGIALDSGGVAKGLFADQLMARLAEHPCVVLDCGGDLRLGGAQAPQRRVDVISPFDTRVIHSFDLASAGVATSGIGRRSWIDTSGSPAHHLLDPATGRPAFTGVVQVTALAPSALEAEARAALLAGPDRARRWLPHGGVVVHDDGSHVVLAPARAGRVHARPRQIQFAYDRSWGRR
jgi:thiamine biosynthesis lipoprotein